MGNKWRSEDGNALGNKPGKKKGNNRELDRVIGK